MELCDYSVEVLCGCGDNLPVQYCKFCKQIKVTRTSTRAHQEKNSSAAKTRKARITNLNTRRLGNVRAHWSLYWINKIIKHTISVHYNNLF